MATAARVRVPCPLCESPEGVSERELAGYTLERCQRCGLVFTNPQPGDEELARHYAGADGRQLAAHYARVVTPAVLAQYNRTLDRIEGLLPGRGRLLDLACAAGYFFEQAARRGWEAHGADLGAWTLEAARSRGLENMHTGTLADLNFPDHHFDVVHAAQMLEHLPDPKAELADIRRIVRPGGLVYVDVPNYQTLPIRLGRDDFWLNKPPEHLNYFTPRTLRRLLTAAGFVDVRVWTGGGLKWENLLGRRIRRDVALGGSDGAVGVPGPAAPPATRRGVGDMVRAVVKAGLVEPVCYQWLKVGMCLAAAARRP
jgi:2-polyprenyl-3-methyl-5-hydroxy-6-metoxy-1,4-benzoquinol methylase